MSSERGHGFYSAVFGLDYSDLLSSRSLPCLPAQPMSALRLKSKVQGPAGDELTSCGSLLFSKLSHASVEITGGLRSGVSFTFTI